MLKAVSVITHAIQITVYAGSGSSQTAQSYAHTFYISGQIRIFLYSFITSGNKSYAYTPHLIWALSATCVFVLFFLHIFRHTHVHILTYIHTHTHIHMTTCINTYVY